MIVVSFIVISLCLIKIKCEHSSELRYLRFHLDKLRKNIYDDLRTSNDDNLKVLVGVEKDLSERIVELKQERDFLDDKIESVLELLNQEHEDSLKSS